MPLLSPNQQCQSTEGKNITFLDSFTPSSPGVCQLCLWPLIVPGYLGGGLSCLSSVLWCQYPVTVSYYWYVWHGDRARRAHQKRCHSFNIFMACTDCVLKSWPPCCRMQPSVLYTLVPLSLSIIIDTSQWAVMPCAWEGNCWSGVTLARHMFQMLVILHQRAQGLRERRWGPAYAI